MSGNKIDITVDRLSLYKYTWQPLITLVLSFLMLISFISLFQTITREKQLNNELISQVNNQISSFSSELYLNEPGAIKMGLQLIINNLNAEYPGSSICLWVLPNKNISEMQSIAVCNDKASNINSGRSQVIPITVGNVKMGKIEYYTNIHLNIANLFPSALLISILIALFIALVCNFFLINRLKTAVILPLIAKISKDAQELATAETMKQVAHDIRSPLVALELLSKHLTGLPEKQKLIVKNVTQRISQIANELLITHALHTNKEQNLIVDTCLAYSLINSIISEKQVQLEKMHIALSVSYNDNCYDAFIKFNQKELKRVLSNIIDNAAEASLSNSKVEVKVARNTNWLMVSIVDEGKGIPFHILPSIFDKGVTYKSQGSGLGLYHAKVSVENYGGKIDVSSTSSRGTTFYIHLPIVETPSWFASSIVADSDTVFVILDDNESIHQVWDVRFKECEISNNVKVSLEHFTSGSELITWYKGQHNKLFLLTDYELADEKMNGLDIIEKLPAFENVILVTSYSEDPQIITRCKNMGIKFMPKDFALYVPIILKQ